MWNIGYKEWNKSGTLAKEYMCFQKTSTAILNAIPKDDLKSYAIIFLNVQIVVFSAKGTISKATNKMQKKTKKTTMQSAVV